jgi:hypothetical protein
MAGPVSVSHQISSARRWSVIYCHRFARDSPQPPCRLGNLLKLSHLMRRDRSSICLVRAHWTGRFLHPALLSSFAPPPSRLSTQGHIITCRAPCLFRPFVDPYSIRTPPVSSFFPHSSIVSRPLTPIPPRCHLLSALLLCRPFSMLSFSPRPAPPSAPPLLPALPANFLSRVKTTPARIGLCSIGRQQ